MADVYRNSYLTVSTAAATHRQMAVNLENRKLTQADDYLPELSGLAHAIVDIPG